MKPTYFITTDIQMTMPKFTSQILLLYSKVLHILENLLLKNFTGLKVSMSCFSKLHVNR